MAQLKAYVRDNNTPFNLTKVRQQGVEHMVALDPTTSLSYLEHTRRNDDVFKKVDNFVEEGIEPTLDENDDSIDKLDSDSDNDDNLF